MSYATAVTFIGYYGKDYKTVVDKLTPLPIDFFKGELEYGLGEGMDPEPYIYVISKLEVLSSQGDDIDDTSMDHFDLQQIMAYGRVTAKKLNIPQPKLWLLCNNDPK